MLEQELSGSVSWRFRNPLCQFVKKEDHRLVNLVAYGVPQDDGSSCTQHEDDVHGPARGKRRLVEDRSVDPKRFFHPSPDPVSVNCTPKVSARRKPGP